MAHNVAKKFCSQEGKRPNVRRGAPPIIKPRRATRSPTHIQAKPVVAANEEGLVNAESAEVADLLPARQAANEGVKTVGDSSAASSVARGEPVTSLSRYFREMATLDVLKPEQELRAARQIEALEISVWEHVFSYPPAADYICTQVQGAMEAPIREVRGYRRLAVAVRASKGRPRKELRERFRTATRNLSERVRELDTDRIQLEALLEELDKLERGIGAAGVARPTNFSVTNRSFKAYRRRVEGAARAAAEARNEFVRANLRLVVSIARRFNHGRMSLADLIQEGNIGLMKAVERYDYRRGFRFSTYASWWIRHAISRALADKGREVRLPVHMIDAYHRIAKATRELTGKLGRAPTTEEIAEAARIPTGKIDKMRTFLVDKSYSLDRPVNDEDGRQFIELLEDPSRSESSPVDDIDTDAMTREVRRLLLELKPIEADILRKRFGLEDDRELTLKEIGEKYNLSRERIRQLQEQALTKMRRAMGHHESL